MENTIENALAFADNENKECPVRLFYDNEGHTIIDANSIAKILVAYAASITPPDQTAAARIVLPSVDEIAILLYRTHTKEETPEGIKTNWDFKEQAMAIIEQLRTLNAGAEGA